MNHPERSYGSWKEEGIAVLVPTSMRRAQKAHVKTHFKTMFILAPQIEIHAERFFFNQTSYHKLLFEDPLYV